MGNLEDLLQRYRNDDRLKQLLTALGGGAEGDQPRIQLTGLRGSLSSFVISAAYKEANQHHLVVANDKEEAAYLQNTVAYLLW